MSPRSLAFAVILSAGIVAPACSAAIASDESTARTADPAETDLRLVIVTDDDFLSDDQRAAWCAAPLGRAIEELQRDRSVSRPEVSMRYAGPPAILRGGASLSGPRRAIGFLCDADDGILAFFVGVPTGRQLIAFIQDAGDVSLLRLADELPLPEARDAEAGDRLVEAIHERSRNRTLRHYRPLLGKVKRETSIAAAAEWLMPALAADRRERFLVSEPSDTQRFLSAQQHVETMRYWCEAMLPAVVGEPVDTVWPELAQLVWQSQPWILPADETDLHSWYVRSINEGPLVLTIDTDSPLLGRPQGSAEPQRTGRALAAEEELAVRREQLLSRTSGRDISLPGLASVLHERGDKPFKALDSAQSLPRWVVLESKESPPVVVSAGEQRKLVDLLGRLLGRP